MFVAEVFNEGRQQLAEIRAGVSGSGHTIYVVQWPTGWQDSGFQTLAEAMNWAQYS